MQNITKKQAANLNALVLAYVGDAAWSLYTRTRLAESYDFKAGELHRLASAEVNAGAQAALSDRLQDILTAEEKEIFVRGRNGKSHHKAKNQSGADYRKATGMEAVIGYLYLTGETERLEYLLSFGATDAPSLD